MSNRRHKKAAEQTSVAEQPKEPLPMPTIEPFPADRNAIPNASRIAESDPEANSQICPDEGCLPTDTEWFKKLHELRDSQPELPKTEVDPESIPVHRRCPLCWGRSKGVGIAYSTQGFTRYYKCKRTLSPDHPPCGFTWSAIVKLDVLRVEHRDIDLETR